MKAKLLSVALFTALILSRCPAEDIVTLDGQKYLGVTDVKAMPDGVLFTLNPKNGIGIVKVPFSKLPDEVKLKYHYDPFEEGIFIARNNKAVNLKPTLFGSLPELDAAKAKAQAENKPLGFILVQDKFFVPAAPMEKGGQSALAHFYLAFHNELVLVAVAPSELANVPEVVKNGLPEAGKEDIAPSMVVVSADGSQFICEIPNGGENGIGGIREKIFREKNAIIRQPVSAATVPPETVTTNPPPAVVTNQASATGK